MQQPAGQEGGDAIASQTRGLREAEQEPMAQLDKRTRNSNDRQQSGWKMQQPTMGKRGNGGWRLQSCRLTRDNITTSRGGQKQDATRGTGGGEGKLVDVRQRCHKRQCGNQLGQTRGKQEVELPACQEAAVLTRGWEAEAA
jgi:hypothetical protein